MIPWSSSTVAPPGRASGAGLALPGASGVPVITGVSTENGPGYFTDQYNHPRMYVTDYAMGLLTNAGKWSSGAWQSDIDNYFATRAAQGLTVHHDPIHSSIDGGAFPATGATWDNVTPWVTGSDPSSGMNPAFWARADYLMASARRNGITVAYAIGESYNWATGHQYHGLTSTQFTALGSAVGARYPSSSYPNIIWFFGDDVAPGDPQETDYNTILAALRGAGANQMVGVYWETETTSRYDPNSPNTPAAPGAATWGVNNSSYDCVYTYQVAYWMPEFAYKAVSFGAPTLRPSVWVDGPFFNGAAAYFAADDRQYRQFWWWTLTSGSRGFLSEATNVYSLPTSAWLTNAQTNWSFINTQPFIVSFFTGLAQWYNLAPDLTSAFFTSGRGTHAAFSTAQYGGFTDSYVSGSITPDHSLAIAYLPNGTTLGVNTGLLPGGWNAYWVDPVSCAVTSAGTGGSYNSTAKGNNSQGDPDWVLVFHA